MKKLLSRLVCLCMAVCLGCTMFAGCSSSIDNSETNLIVEFYDAGYGSKGFEAVKDAFIAKNPDVKVTLISQPGLISTNVESKLTAGPSITTTDLFFCGDVNIRNLIERGEIIKGYPTILENLNDIYSADIDGQTYKNKLMPFYEKYNNINNNYYATNWSSGPNGIVYRADYFTANNWEVPATTDELVELIAKIKNAGYTPFTWPGTTGYWAYATQVWWAQYAGDEQMENFYNGLDMYGDLSADCFNTPAFLKAYEALEDCIYDKTNSYTGSIGLDKTRAQGYLYSNEKKVCMMPNGAWLENEMAASGYAKGSVDVKMMKVPLLSSVLKTSAANGSETDRFDTVKDEATLRAVVKAIDRGETSYENVSSDDFAEIKYMRNYVSTLGNLLQAVIPAYSNAKGLAKEFLKFMATDEAIQLFYDNSSAILPFNTTINYAQGSTDFAKSLLDVSKNANSIALNASTNKLFYMTELDFQIKVPEEFIGSESSADKKTAAQFFNEQVTYVSGRWSMYKTQAGVQ